MEPLSEVRALIDMTEDDDSEFTRSMIEDILHNLGARIDTRYNVNITHLIWQDGQNEKILKKCQNSSSIHIVSPLWVVECQQANEKVEENAWPAEIVSSRAKQIDITPSPTKEPVASKSNEAVPQEEIESSCNNLEAKSDNSPKSKMPSKKRKAATVKKSPHKKPIVLSSDETDDVPTDEDPVPNELITPRKKPLGTKNRQGSATKPGKLTGKKKSMANEITSELDENDENVAPKKSTSTPKSKQPKSDTDYDSDNKSKKNLGSAKKQAKSASVSLSQLSDFVRDAAYDLAKNHPEYVIIENCDAKYVVIEKPVRTIKVFYALAKGSWIISAEWILSSVTAGRWLNPEDFEFRDLPSKKSREARSDPKFKGLFQGELVYVREGVEPGQSILQELFLICGAQITPDEESASAVIAANGESGGISPKWLLDSLIVFEKQDSEGYLTAPLSPDI